MFETKKRIDGYLVDHGKFNVVETMLNECLADISNVRGRGGEYRIRVQWFSEDELADERRKEGE